MLFNFIYYTFFLLYLLIYLTFDINIYKTKRKTNNVIYFMIVLNKKNVYIHL